MKTITGLVIAIIAVIVINKMFSSTDSDTNTLSASNCVALNQRMMEMGDLSPQDMEALALCDQRSSAPSGDDCKDARQKMKAEMSMGKVETSKELWDKVSQCNREQLARTESSGSKNRIPGNSTNHPRGALAHYKWLGNLEYFTVYDDRIQIKPTSYPKNVTTIRFEDIEKLEENVLDVAGIASGIGITYRDDSGKLKRYSIAIYSDADIGLPKEKTEQGRLYLLLERQWGK